MMYLNNLALSRSSSIVLVVLFFLLGVHSAQAAKFGVVNVDLISQNYSLVQESGRVLAKLEERARRIVATAEQELKSLKEQKIDEKEFDLKQSAIQATVDKELADFEREKESYNSRINTNITKALADLAAEKKLEVIVDQVFVVSGGLDITKELLDKLEKTASSSK